MSDLTEFLLARIAEDERAAHRIALPLALTGAKGAVVGPGRVLAECEAKRRIVAEANRFEGDDDPGAHVLVGVLELLALPYADHPDYREEWRP